MSDLTPEDILKHYGVKGMRWGVTKKDTGGGDRPSSSKSGGTSKTSAAKNDGGSGGSTAKKTDAELTAMYKSIPEPKLSVSQQAKNVAASQKKFLAKAGIDEQGAITGVDEKKVWTPTGKQVAYTVAGAAVVGLIAYGGYKAYTGGYGPKPSPGSPISAEHYNFLTMQSKITGWSGGYIKPSSYDRPEFTLPAGHTFHRISTTMEEGFKTGTYATADIDDYNRYLTAFRGEKGASAVLNHLTFNTKEEIRVPKLTDTLEAMREAMAIREGVSIDAIAPKKALLEYNHLSGGSWSGPGAETFFDVLQKKGFGAIVDEMDAGVVGERPLVVFAKGSLTDKVGSLITPENIAEAESSLTEIANRK